MKNVIKKLLCFIVIALVPVVALCACAQPQSGNQDEKYKVGYLAWNQAVDWDLLQNFKQDLTLAQTSNPTDTERLVYAFSENKYYFYQTDQGGSDEKWMVFNDAVNGATVYQSLNGGNVSTQSDFGATRTGTIIDIKDTSICVGALLADEFHNATYQAQTQSYSLTLNNKRVAQNPRAFSGTLVAKFENDVLLSVNGNLTVSEGGQNEMTVTVAFTTQNVEITIPSVME